MKIFELSASRYDKGIYILTLGNLDKIYNRLTLYIKKGDRVLDLGCGTGALTLRTAYRGAKVKGIDINPQMLEIARKRVIEAGFRRTVKLCEMSVMELGREDVESYDAIMAGLFFSELNDDEIDYVLKEIWRILRPGGFLLVVDEVVPENIFKRVIWWLIRLPLTIIVYFVTGTTTRALSDLPKKIKRQGFIIESMRLNRMENLIELVARRPRNG